MTRSSEPYPATRPTPTESSSATTTTRSVLPSRSIRVRHTLPIDTSAMTGQNTAPRPIAQPAGYHATSRLTVVARRCTATSAVPSSVAPQPLPALTSSRLGPGRGGEAPGPGPGGEAQPD